MRIDMDGNVGIGTISPTAGFKLDVVGADFRVSDVIGDDGVELGWSAGASAGFVQAYDRGAAAFRNLKLNNSVTIEAAGDVGIGTDSPNYKLEIDGTTDFGNTTTYNDGAAGLISWNSGTKFKVKGQSGHALSLGANGTEDYVWIATGGNVGIGTTTPSEELTVIGDILIDNGGDSTLYLGKGAEGVDGVTKIKSVQTGTDTDQLGIAFNVHPSTAGSAVSEEAMRIDHAGNVGIGVTNPSYKLHTVGGAGVFDVIGASGLDNHLAVTEVATLPDWRPYSGTSTAALQIQSSATRGILLAAKSTGNQDFYNTDGLDIYVASTMGASSSNKGTLAMSIISGGNVGIGTDNPTQKLEVYSGRVFINNQTNISPDSSGNGQFNIQGSGYTGYTTLDATSMYIGHNSSNRDLRLQTNETDRVTIDGSTGNVGIGTTAPGNTLELFSSAPVLAIKDGGTYGTNASSYIDFKDSSSVMSRVGVVDATGTLDINNLKANSIRFQTNNSTQVTVTSAGNVGIGTDSPGTLLDVRGIVSVRESSNVAFYGGNYIRVFVDANFLIREVGGATRLNLNTTNGDLSLYNSSTVLTNHIDTAGNSYFNGGNVGIGITNPITKLNIKGDQSANGQLYIEPTNDSEYAGLVIKTTRGADRAYAIFAGGTGTDDLNFRFRDASAGADRMVIDSSGNVGIGTTSPTRKLEISGDVRVMPSSGDVKITLTDQGVRSWDLRVSDGSDYFEIDGTTSTSLVVTGAGNVGIGTTAPGNHKLKVVGETHSTHFITGEDWTAKTGGLHIGNDGLTTGAVSFYNSGDGGSSANIYRDSNLFYVGARGGVWSRGLVIDSTGNTCFGGNVLPTTDNTMNLGSSSARWANVYANCTTTGAVIESNLCTNGLDSCPEGSVVIWRDGELQGTTDAYSHRVMGVTAPGSESPIVMGAENILVTGDIEEGDPIVTSDKYNHGMRGDRSEDLHGKVIAEALESGSGESYIIKGMIRKF
jgi:hypothetical protein